MQNKKQLVVLILIAIGVVVYFRFGMQHNADAESNANAAESNHPSQNSTAPLDFLPTSTTGAIVTHHAFVLSYAEDFEQAEWVAYELLDSQLQGTHFKRPFFIQDPKVKTGSADWRNYKKSGYDKGHLCPAGDRTFSKLAFEETFLTSNISPQLHDFNSGVWNRLEQKVRYWAQKYHKVQVISGGILDKNLKSIGSERVAVPAYFYKILGAEIDGNYQLIAFLVPHESSEKPLYEFVVSVDEIEKRTKIDFFPAIEDQLENRLEKAVDYKGWSFN